MIEIQNIEYVKPHMILKFDVVSGSYRDVCSYEIPPANIVNNQWVLTSSQDYNVQEIKDLIEKSHATVWETSVINKYKKSRESEIVESYNERTLSDEQFAQILAAVPELLPNGYFFHPNQLFIDKMKELYQGKQIIDCGAGNGHTGKILSEAGFDVTCIDIAPYMSYEFPVKIMNALDFKFDDSMVCLICRPDHEDWFLKTMDQSLKNNCPVIYVRKKKIISGDAKLIAEHVGADDEYMFSVKP